MRIRTTALAAAMLASASVAPAQSIGRMLVDDFKYIGKDAIAVWGAPFDASGKDWALAAGSFALFGVSMFADQSVSDWAIRNDSSTLFRALEPLRRGGVLFSGKYVVPPAGAMYLIGLATKNQGMRDFVTGCMTSWLAQGTVRRVAAYTFGRARPDSLPNDPHHWELGAGHGDSEEAWLMRSFPAGHFANAIGCATFANERFKLGAFEPVIYAIAVGVGVGRWADEAHWFSDTVIGGILGYAVGREVAHRSLKRQEARTSGGVAGGAGLSLAPTERGINVTLNWRF